MALAFPQSRAAAT